MTWKRTAKAALWLLVFLCLMQINDDLTRLRREVSELEKTLGVARSK